MSLQDRDFFLTIEHPCAYFEDRVCQNVVPDPKIAMQADAYDQLAIIGFRRSGDHVYRPHCPDCQDCVPCRIRVASFKPTRSQRRCMKRNSEVICQQVKAEFTPEYYQLYKKYLNIRHADGDMKNPSEADFTNFLVCDWSHSHFLTFRENDQLLAIAVIDKVANGYSAVYTFYDPELSDRGLGIFAILQQIKQCQQHRLPYLYLGYWINQHPKMHYKVGFDSIELFKDNHWQRKENILTE